MTDDQNDPIQAYARNASGKRRLGMDGRCVCGEERAEALSRKNGVVRCAACRRAAEGRSIYDKHHIAGKANSSITMLVPVNDHRAWLSPDQYNWPKKTLENPDRSPLLAVAACIRGFIDIAIYLMKTDLICVAERLETLDDHLTSTWGPRWWINFEAVTKGANHERK